MKGNRVLILILVLALVIRIIFVFSSPLKIWDETVYANLGYNLKSNPFDYSFANNGWSDFIPCKDNPIYCFPKAGFRAPLLPYTISLMYFLKLDFLIEFLMPVIGTFTVFLVFVLGKKLFSKNIGLYSALFLALLPVHIVYSGKILTDAFVTFFCMLTFIIFWKGYEENNKKYKMLFGVFLALALSARYTVLWIAPVFLIYFLIRDKSLKFVKDKYIWYSVLIFLIILIPWFIYGISEYKNPLGGFIHGLKASSYWGGTQPWYEYIKYGFNIFSAIALVFLLSLGYIFYKKEFLKKEVYLLLISIFFFFVMASVMPHKEDRFILPIAPAVCIISGFFIDKIKHYKKMLLIIIVLVLFFSTSYHFYYDYKRAYTPLNICFLEGNKFLKNIKGNALVITDESPIIYYYSKKETHFYPNPRGISSLKNLIENNYKIPAYIFFTEFEMPLENEKNLKIKQDLDANFEKVFECYKDGKTTIIYKY